MYENDASFLSLSVAGGGGGGGRIGGGAERLRQWTRDEQVVLGSNPRSDTAPALTPQSVILQVSRTGSPQDDAEGLASGRCRGGRLRTMPRGSPQDDAERKTESLCYVSKIPWLRKTVVQAKLRTFILIL